MHIAINRNMHNIFYLFQFLRVSRESHYSGDRSTLSWTWVLPGRSLPSPPQEGPHQPSFPACLILTLPQGPQPEKLPSLCLLRPTLSCGHGTMSLSYPFGGSGTICPWPPNPCPSCEVCPPDPRPQSFCELPKMLACLLCLKSSHDTCHKRPCLNHSLCPWLQAATE